MGRRSANKEPDWGRSPSSKTWRSDFLRKRRKKRKGSSRKWGRNSISILSPYSGSHHNPAVLLFPLFILLLGLVAAVLLITFERSDRSDRGLDWFFNSNPSAEE